MRPYQNIGEASGIYTLGGRCFLSHYGIQGQKWGVRRFQNTDGSLTSAGRERYGYGKATIGDRARSAGRKVGTAFRNAVENRRIRKTYGKGAVKNIKRVTKGKRLSEMSDAEIRKKIERLHLENQLLSEIKTKNQTALDMSNARKNRVTWYSRYGQDLVKTAIDKYANSQVRASRVKAEIDRQQKNYSVRSAQKTQRYKHDNVDATEKYKADSTAGRIDRWEKEAKERNLQEKERKRRERALERQRKEDDRRFRQNRGSVIKF